MRHERIYLDPNDNRVYIDTYVADLGECRPAMLVIPGGAYLEVCADREGEPIAIDFLAKGYNAFVLNYRTGWGGAPFAQLIDAARAMIYLRENATHLKIDPKRVFAVGFSAGGHLCYALATMYEYPEVKAVFGEKCALVRPTGIISGYGVAILNRNKPSGTYRIFAAKDEFTEADVERLSIEKIVTPTSSPMFIWHTAEDKSVNQDVAMIMGMALKRVGVPHYVAVYPYGGHGSSLATEITAREGRSDIQPLAANWTGAAAAWLSTLPDSNI